MSKKISERKQTGQKYIKIIGARQNNLKNINCKLPKNSMVVMTGPSGSGKSSLAFDTIYAEGQRRYMESLSSYARQFLGMAEKPLVDEIEGLSPAISIEQKGKSHNPRSTVGTVTEIYDYLRLLFGRAGKPYCPSCGRAVTKYSVDEIVDKIFKGKEESAVHVLSPMVRAKKGQYKNLFASLASKGYTRVRVDGALYRLDEEIELEKNEKHTIDCVIDRMKLREENRARLTEAVEMALKLSSGFVVITNGEDEQEFTENYVCPHCEISLPEIEPRLFSFNAPIGACPDCAGLGFHSHFSPEIAVDSEKTLAEGAFVPWKNTKYMLERANMLAEKKKWNLDVPFGELPKEMQDALLYGDDTPLELVFTANTFERNYTGKYIGLIPWLEKRYGETESEQLKEELERYCVEDTCAACGGHRLKKEALAVRLGDYNIADLTSMSVEEHLAVLNNLKLGKREQKIVGVAMDEIKKRLQFLVNIGAGYLSLDRRADTLSGGESQRIRLASQLGSGLTGVMYVLDEPTIGLHARDTSKLLGTLKTIRDLGNTVLVVEHDKETMEAADYIVEIGPGAGENGGKITAEGEFDEFIHGTAKTSDTGKYLRGEENGIEKPKNRRKSNHFLTVKGCAENNLKNIDISIPLGTFTCLTGVSGSGKSTFLYEILYKGLRHHFDSDFRALPGKFKSITGADRLKNIVLIDQSPIGRTPRSNPATYTGVFSAIRELFAEMTEAKMRGYTPGRFSFNVKGGRCEACNGDGVTKVSMLFLPDVYVKCDVCGGKRYNRETLEVKFNRHTIADVLDMTVDEASRVFANIPKIANRLATISEAGLGYIKLGQSSTTLSGGEAQRVKLATELAKKFQGPTLYLLDEPTTGLHYTDVKKLLKLLHKLVDNGHSVLAIEHNLDILASSDYVIDLGPDGGKAGGKLVAKGTPEEVAKSRGFTAKFLKEYLEENMH